MGARGLLAVLPRVRRCPVVHHTVVHSGQGAKGPEGPRVAGPSSEGRPIRRVPGDNGYQTRNRAVQAVLKKKI